MEKRKALGFENCSTCTPLLSLMNEKIEMNKKINSILFKLTLNQQFEQRIEK